MQNRKSSNTIVENAKKGSAYGGFFGSSLGFVAGLIEFRNRGYWPMGVNPKGVLTTVGLVVGVSAGTIVGTSLGLFGGKNKQRVCQSNMITDKTNELKNTNQTTLKK